MVIKTKLNPNTLFLKPLKREKAKKKVIFTAGCDDEISKNDRNSQGRFGVKDETFCHMTRFKRTDIL